MADIETPVLIVGGSLVGLSAAMLLARQGVGCVAVERHSGTAVHPRAAHATQRTMEIFRCVGLETAIRERSAEQFVQDGGVVAVETLLGGVTAEFIADLNAGIRDVSPCERVFLSQNALEPLLRQRASQLGARIQFSTEALSIEEHAEGVTTLLKDRQTGEISRAHSQYVIAADGAHSKLRAALGIGMQGRPPFSRSITLYFRASLRSILESRRWAVVYVNNPQLRGFFRFEKPFDSAFLVVNTQGDPKHPVRDVSTALTPERALELIALALGSRDIPVAIDSIMHWDAAAQVAERYQTARVFIAGDAAHIMPPTGGFGGNTGVQDAHDLAWKLALVIQGRASPALLETYEVERRPVGSLAVEQAYTRYVLRTDPSLDAAHCQPLVHDLNIELGYVYRSKAVVAESEVDGLTHMSPRESRGRPGTRAPHLWLTNEGRRVSTLDLYDGCFVLLAGPDAQLWRRCTETASAEIGLRVAVRQPGWGGLEDPSGELCAMHGLEPEGCVLVRPDGFVGWRARNADRASPERIKAALNQILGRC